NLPAATVTRRVDPGPKPNFTSTELQVKAVDKATTRVAVTLVPLSVGIPDRVVVQPLDVTLDPGAEQQFSALIWSGSVQLNISPSWMVEGAIGTINAQGKFVATKSGQGKVVAVAGSQRGEASVTVTGPKRPRLWSIFIDPQLLPASGGQATITVHVSDGDGIRSVSAVIYKPDNSSETVQLRRTAGTEKDGTWVATYSFPRNTASIDPLGHQAPQVYDIKITATDKSGASRDSDFYQVTVRGIAPPPPPSQ
ncbi:MAG: hypothetical protein H5T86_15490, partial [Armatimonadetes bacterium]|nr:hypothetical protein [Armatimonadota bacterium]